MIQSFDRDLAELRFGSGHRQKKTKNKSRAEQEPRSAHGCAVKKKSRAEQEPRSAYGHAVNKSRVEQEPRSAHGRAVKKTNKSRAEQEPRSAHGRAVNKVICHQRMVIQLSLINWKIAMDILGC